MGKAMHDNTIQNRTSQDKTKQDNTIQHNTIKYKTIQSWTIQYKQYKTRWGDIRQDMAIQYSSRQDKQL